MIYADFDFYITEYGGDLDEKAFNQQAKKASRLIDNRTNGRARRAFQNEKMREKLQLATCTIAELLEAKELHSSASQNGTIQTENNDGYSVTFKDATSVTAKFEADINARLEEYLTSPVNLLLRWI